MTVHIHIHDGPGGMGQVSAIGHYAKTTHYATGGGSVLCGAPRAIYATTNKGEVTCANCLKRLERGQSARLSQAAGREERKRKEAEAEEKLKREMGW